MSVQGGSAVGLPAPADKPAPKIAFPHLCNQPRSGILRYVSIGVCPFQDFHAYFSIWPSKGRQEEEYFSKPTSRASASPPVQPPLPFPSASVSSRREAPLLQSDDFSLRSNPSGIRAQRSLLGILCSRRLLQETTFSNHVIIYGAQSWVFTHRFPCWQVAAEPYTSDGLKSLPISCLNAFGASLYLCSCAKVGAWITALPPLMHREWSQAFDLLGWTNEALLGSSRK